MKEKLGNFIDQLNAEFFSRKLTSTQSFFVLISDNYWNEQIDVIYGSLIIVVFEKFLFVIDVRVFSSSVPSIFIVLIKWVWINSVA